MREKSRQLFSQLKRFRTALTDPWVAAAMILFVLITLPIWSIFFQLWGGPGEEWMHLVEYRLSLYFSNTFILLTSVLLFTFLLGLGCAWMITFYRFPLRSVFEWMLVLPLGVPSYIMAYTYTGILDYSGSGSVLLSSISSFPPEGRLIDIMNMPGAIFILSISLFPYVYLLSRASIQSQLGKYYEAASVLGHSPFQIFVRVILPLARPAVIGGMALVGMEVLNDYGAVKYLGVPTFTTGIFRSWFSLGDIQTATYLSAILMAFVFTILIVEGYQRGRKRYSGEEVDRTFHRKVLPISGQWILSLSCGWVLLVSFILPLCQLIYWVTLTAEDVLGMEFFRLAFRSFSLALASGVLIAAVAIVFQYAIRKGGGPGMRYIAKWATMGYAIPGAIIAVGLLIPLLGFDHWMMQRFEGVGLILTGGTFALVLAYVVRFLAVGYNSIESGFEKVGKGVHEVSKTLGAHSLKTLWKVDLPLIRGSLVGAIILVFVDLLKELPLTLILRPFNFDTLATRAFDMATNEMVAESANASLIIVLTSILPVLLLNKMMKKNHGISKR